LKFTFSITLVWTWSLTAGFEVFTAMKFKTVVFWITTSQPRRPRLKMVSPSGTKG